MTTNSFTDILDLGKYLFTEIGDELNTYSDQYIRIDQNKYRREVDHIEICVALALLALRNENETKD
jgi:hypothetical protein